MILLNVGITQINYKTLVSKITEQQSRMKKVNNKNYSLWTSLIKLLIWPSSNLVLKVGSPTIVKMAEEYGLTITLKTYNRKSKTTITEGNFIFRIAACIESLDKDKLARSIRPIATSDKTTTKSTSLNDVIRIVAPFIDTTLETIPPKAVAELFSLFGKKKISELADNIGIKLSDLSIVAD